jgi:hypothetical protein
MHGKVNSRTQFYFFNNVVSKLDCVASNDLIIVNLEIGRAIA